MKLLRMYYLDGYGLSPDQCLRIKESLGLDHIIQVQANNQLEHTQYPVFEFDEIGTEQETKRIKSEISEEDMKRVYENEVRKVCERDTTPKA